MKIKGLPPPSSILSYWKSIAYRSKAFVVAFAVLFSFSASGQSISGATSVVAGQTYTYSSGCSSTSWYVTNGTIIQNNGDGVVLVQWTSAGSGSISISGCAYLDVVVSVPPPPCHNTEYIGLWYSTYSRNLIIGDTYSVTLSWLHNGTSSSEVKIFTATSNIIWTLFQNLYYVDANITQVCITNLSNSSCPTSCQ